MAIQLNGWRRLWLVLSGFGVLTGGLIYPWKLSQDARINYFDYDLNVRQDYRAPVCQDYINKIFSDLTEPKYGENCYHLYNTRRFGSKDTVPFTIEVHNSDKNKWYWRVFFESAAVFGTFSIVVSLVIYLLGFLVAWIRRGFTRPAT